ncbi:monooxygenase [Penicillium sp. IBT 16267x]|nr:monooxygenase [Penicillium sp. IBT 16267x]
MDLDTDVLIIGAGLSGLGLAVQLVRQYGHRNSELIENADHIGGTWLANSYPGCGVDSTDWQVDAHYYSYSFCLNPDWSRKYPLQPEILDYSRVWPPSTISKSMPDSLHCQLGTLGRILETYHRRCKILVSAVGILSIPNECDIDGASSFKGPLFHTAQWDHSFDWKDKNLVVTGNGCSATQVVPALSNADDGAARKITQFARRAQWMIFERPNPPYSSRFRWTMKWVPLAMRAYRAVQNYYAELDFFSFPTESGAGIRKMYADTQGAYILEASPSKYHDFLIPKTEVGCKRRVMDSDYLQSLHRDNVELVYQDPRVNLDIARHEFFLKKLHDPSSKFQYPVYSVRNGIVIAADRCCRNDVTELERSRVLFNDYRQLQQINLFRGHRAESN